MWSLYTGGLYIQVQQHGKYTPGDLQNAVLLAGGLYIHMVFRAGLTAPFVVAVAMNFGLIREDGCKERDYCILQLAY